LSLQESTTILLNDVSISVLCLLLHQVASPGVGTAPWHSGTEWGWRGAPGRRLSGFRSEDGRARTDRRRPPLTLFPRQGERVPCPASQCAGIHS